MGATEACDAIVIGSGPNGLAAAIELARAGRAVTVLEGAETIGGGTRSAELTLPGFLHDVCSAVHPLAVASPFFRRLPLVQHGLEWIHPPLPLAHPFDDGTAAVLERSLAATADRLGPDGRDYRRLMAPLVRMADAVLRMVLGPMRPPRHPLALARFGWLALRSADGLAGSRLRGPRARALFAGLAAHSMLPLDRPPSAAFALILALAAHAVGWPLPRGGSQRIADALAGYFRSLGGRLETGRPVVSLADLPPTSLVLCDVTPRQLLRLAGSLLPADYRRRLEAYRYGVGAFKMDWALDAPIPWRAADCARAGTVHVGGAAAEVAAAERAPWSREHADRPFVLLAQPSLFDPTRAPRGKHTVWAYCHVPHGSREDMAERIEAQIERFAPGFRSRILARSVLPPAELERRNPNLIGGDISGGVPDMAQLIARPTLRLYTTPAQGVYLCSASTPPGGGVHGMCGFWAARRALRARTRAGGSPR